MLIGKLFTGLCFVTWLPAFLPMDQDHHPHALTLQRVRWRHVLNSADGVWSARTRAGTCSRMRKSRWWRARLPKMLTETKALNKADTCQTQSNTGEFLCPLFPYILLLLLLLLTKTLFFLNVNQWQLKAEH